ncbi:MAG: hypothetical protein ACP5GW_00910, partial [Caldisericaceae bacterium]
MSDVIKSVNLLFKRRLKESEFNSSANELGSLILGCYTERKRRKFIFATVNLIRELSLSQDADTNIRKIEKINRNLDRIYERGWMDYKRYGKAKDILLTIKRIV